MGFRFQRRIKVLPGVRLNVSKGGVSTSVGTRGARVTLGRGKRRTTVGIPGTGLSHTSVESTGSGSRGLGAGALVLIAVVFLLLVWALA
jgi:hypothetical protein